MPRGIAEGLAELGWTKEKVKAYLWEHSKVPYDVISSDSVIFATEKRLSSLTLRLVIQAAGSRPQEYHNCGCRR